MHKGPEKQHILPRFYLNAFSEDYPDEGLLNVIDFRRGKVFKTKASNIVQKGFYNLHGINSEKYAIETMLAEFESTVAPYFHNVLKNGVFQGGHELSQVLSLAGLIHARGEWMRHFLNNGLPVKMVIDIMKGDVSQEKWNLYLKSQREAGLNINKYPSYNNLKEAIKSGFIPDAPINEKNLLIGGTYESLMDSIAFHKWNLFRTNKDSGCFISSICPLVWSTTDRGIAPWEHFNLKEKEVFITCPLSRNYTLVNGGKEWRGSTYNASINKVAFINQRTLLQSGGLIYSGADEFFVLDSANKYVKKITVTNGKVFNKNHKRYTEN